jgi:hypothetical protein
MDSLASARLQRVLDENQQLILAIVENQVAFFLAGEAQPPAP